MSIWLTDFVFQTPFLMAFLVIALALNVFLTLTSVRNRHVLWWSKRSVADIKKRLNNELESQGKRDHHFESKMARLEHQLKKFETRACQNEAKIEHLNLELSYALQSAQRGGVMILRELKKELLSGIDKIEEIEDQLGSVDIAAAFPKRHDDTLTFWVEAKQTLDSVNKQLKGKRNDKEKLDLVSAQLVIPGLET